MKKQHQRVRFCILSARRLSILNTEFTDPNQAIEPSHSYNIMLSMLLYIKYGEVTRRVKKQVDSVQLPTITICNPTAAPTRGTEAWAKNGDTR